MPFPPTPPWVPPPRRGPRPEGPRNLLGAVTFVAVLLGAVMAIFPATAPIGCLLCLIMIVPAILAHRRTRTGRATHRGRTLATLIAAPIFLVVSVAVGATATVPIATTSETVVGNAKAATPSVPPAHAPSAIAAPADVAVAAAPTPTVTKRPPVRTPARPQVATQAHAKPSQSAQPSQSAKPTKPPTPAQPLVSALAGSACDDASHYVNSSGKCVPRPEAAVSPPAGATALCKDGTYSSSQTSSGTCSKHGGVKSKL